jgi:hypothetical protein
LPVSVGGREIGQLAEPFLPSLTPAGRRHPIFANIVGFFPSQNAGPEIDGLPPLEGCVRVDAARPGATVLAVHPHQTAGPTPMPVMAVQPVGEGRAAVLTADTTRPWHQAMRALDRESPFLRFWGQTARWLAGTSDDVETGPGIVATSDKAQYEPESTTTLSAVVRGAEGQGATGAKVVAQIDGPDGQTTRLEMAAVPGPAGNYEVRFEPPRSGRYEVVVEAQLPETRLTAEAISFDVGRRDLEFDRLDLDQSLLVGIARASNGRYAHITTADRLIELLRKRHQKRQVQYELPLAWPPLLWVLFVGVLTTEWLLRRKYYLR